MKSSCPSCDQKDRSDDAEQLTHLTPRAETYPLVRRFDLQIHKISHCGWPEPQLQPLIIQRVWHLIDIDSPALVFICLICIVVKQLLPVPGIQVTYRTRHEGHLR